MKRRTALIIISFCLALSVQAFDFKIGNLVFVTNEQGSSVSVMAEGVPFREENLSLLDSVVIPSSVTYSGTTYPVTSIGRGAFQYCTRMTSLTIPSSITSIAEQAFPNCRSLKQFIVPADHPKYTTTEGVLFTKEMDTLIAYPNSKAAAYIIPKDAKTIAKGAFQFCYDLSSVTIPEGVTTIGSKAFSSCHSLKEIVIPQSVRFVGDEAFSNCSNITTVTIPEGVTTIGSKAFSSCDSLKEIVIPQSVRFVGDDAFSYCSNITTITIPSCITTYRESFFRGCKALKQYVVPRKIIRLSLS